MSKFEIGDYVKAVDNYYWITNSYNNWIGRVIEVEGNTFKAITIEATGIAKRGEVYRNLNKTHFEKVK